MRLLFVGSEEDLNKAVSRREGDGLPSFFFAESLPDESIASHWDAIVIPAAQFLTIEAFVFSIPVMASGPGALSRECFEAGCTDYLREPWTIEELEARVFAKTKDRFAIQASGGVVIAERGRLSGQAGCAALSSEAYDALSLLWRNANMMVPREAFGAGYRSGSRALDMRMTRLRTALRAVGHPDLAGSIRALSGGYTFIRQ